MKGETGVSSSSSIPNFDSVQYKSQHEDLPSGSYQNFKDQKEAFFTKKQQENSGRPEYALKRILYRLF